MAYALGLPSELTALLCGMVDWRYETRGWRSEMQTSHNTRRAFAADGTRLVYNCMFTHNAPSQIGRLQQRINAKGLEEFEAVYDWDEDDNGVIDVDSGRWYFYHQPARKPEIVVDNPAKTLRGRSYKPWNKLKALGA